MQKMQCSFQFTDKSVVITHVPTGTSVEVPKEGTKEESQLKALLALTEKLKEVQVTQQEDTPVVTEKPVKKPSKRRKKV